MCMWMFGIAYLIIYSFVLFYLMKKYYDRIKKDYDVLMRGVQRIAEGDLDTMITEDIGGVRTIQRTAHTDPHRI